jgi:tRNA threonylcarbamoyladenosine biosynthesis protein TsaB
MSLTLLLETSSHRYSAALIDDSAPAEVLDYRETTRTAPDYDGVPGLAAAALEAVGEPFRRLARIVVDVGPGNLTSVRSGVAYANALSYALGVRLLGPNSLELLALSARAPGATPRSPQPPVLGLRKAGGTTVYAGLFGVDGAPPAYAVGELSDVVKRVAADRPAFTVAGAFRDRVAGVLPEGSEVTDSGLELPDARAVHSWFLAQPPAASGGLLVPLTENSGIFVV